MHYGGIEKIFLPLYEDKQALMPQHGELVLA